MVSTVLDRSLPDAFKLAAAAAAAAAEAAVDDPPAAPFGFAAPVVRIRAYWNASAAISATNFSAARDKSRFLSIVRSDNAFEYSMPAQSPLTDVYLRTRSRPFPDNDSSPHQELMAGIRRA
jgi:hypothetical protein